ncbi:MAG: phosphatidylserine/phosphatidylglycerophosphate/cardiolipin synthase family protein [Peptococcaceae bacterium]|nr:phosphatidylserine/phosphatidylglycerophosphate/cardiolipin synthase family protein [Peptococcaceae bacterium]
MEKSYKHNLYKKSMLLCIFIIFTFVFFLCGCENYLSFEKNDLPKISNLTEDNILVNSDEIRLETINLIKNAEEAIFIELSAFDDHEILDLIIEKAHRGIEVRILLDQWQSVNSKTVKKLKNENISVQYYPAQKGQYHKVRFMVVDYQTAVYYCQDWLEKSYETYNFAVVLSGSSVKTITKSFINDWAYTTTISLELPDKINLTDDYVSYTVNAGIKQQILKAINSAQSEAKIYVEQLSDKEIIEALNEAKKRGCEVKLILSPASKESISENLLDTQIDIKYFNHPQNMTMGFNLGVFDNEKILVTSSPWTYYTFVINHENALIIPSPSVAKKIVETLKSY